MGKCNSFESTGRLLAGALGSATVWAAPNIGCRLKNGELSVSLNINRKLLYNDGSMRTTDINWYLDKLLPALNQDDMLIESFSYEEYIS